MTTPFAFVKNARFAIFVSNFHLLGTYPLTPFLRGRGNQISPPRVGEGSGRGQN